MLSNNMENISPAVVSKVKKLLELAAKESLPIAVNQGYRSIVEQDNLYAQGRTKPGKKVTNAKGGQSWHNFGLAVDIVFVVNGSWSWAESNDWDRLGKLGESVGLEWGGSWVSFKDRPHFQSIGSLTLSKARDLYKQGGLATVWMAANS